MNLLTLKLTLYRELLTMDPDVISDQEIMILKAIHDDAGVKAVLEQIQINETTLEGIDG